MTLKEYIDPYLYGQIAAANAISDVYAMGGEPKLALNIMCITETMDKASRSWNHYNSS